MSETKETTTSTESTPASFGDALASARATAPVETPAPAAEVKTEAPPPAVETKPADPTPAAAPAPAAVTTPEDPREREIQGLRHAMIAERQKAKDLAQKLSEYEGTGAPTEPAQGNGAGDPRFVKMSEMLARQQFPDYDEKWNAFAKECAGDPGKGIPPNHALYESVMGSEFPGMAMYQAGKSLIFGEKYGRETLADPEKLAAAVEKNLSEKLEKKVRAELEAKMLGTARERSNQPTLIGQGKAAASASDVAYVDPGFGGLLERARARAR